MLYSKYLIIYDLNPRSWKIITDVGKFSLVNRSIADRDRLPEGAIPSLKRMYAERGLGKYISEVK
jgi:hypothetical protein